MLDKHNTTQDSCSDSSSVALPLGFDVVGVCPLYVSLCLWRNFSVWPIWSVHVPQSTVLQKASYAGYDIFKVNINTKYHRWANLLSQLRGECYVYVKRSFVNVQLFYHNMPSHSPLSPPPFYCCHRMALAAGASGEGLLVTMVTPELQSGCKKVISTTGWQRRSRLIRLWDGLEV